MLTKIVGGPWAGRSVELRDEAQVLRVPVYDYEMLTAEGMYPLGYQPVNFKTVDYHRQRVYAGDTVFTILAPVGWLPDEVMRELIEQYAKATPATTGLSVRGTEPDQCKRRTL